ncbi:hypothetical protein RDI58_017717 [Solanum bulbocastanum]|uniref:Uncharacterized protein n=1 Tax=Solanum bulbocastanum TaxID=147425 RepID=A0AAN8T994_SOLBU
MSVLLSIHPHPKQFNKKYDFVVDTKLKGKGKLVEDNFPHDIDFEDEIPLSKRLRVNNDQCLKKVGSGSGSKGTNGLNPEGASSINKKRKKSIQPPEIYFDHLKKGMFRKYDNQYMFEDLVFMDDELAIVEAENLIVLTDLAFNKKSERDRSLRQNENLQTHSVVRQNDKDLPHNSSHRVGSDPSLTFNKDLQKIAQEVVKIWL